MKTYGVSSLFVLEMRGGGEVDVGPVSILMREGPVLGSQGGRQVALFLQLRAALIAQKARDPSMAPPVLSG